MAKRLLILACSERKKHIVDSIPAVDRYDGPMWKVLRSFIRSKPSSATEIDIYVLSAEFGLIPATQKIPWYDRIMTRDRANELQETTLKQFQLLINTGYSGVCLGLSQLYLLALDGWEHTVPTSTSVLVTDGPMTTKLGQLRAWLQGEIWEPKVYLPNQLLIAKSSRSEVVLNGVSLRLSREEVLERARAALAAGAPAADRFRNWCVRVDGRPVAAKWLVSLISGERVQSFDPSEARRVLLGLGIDVEHMP